MIYEGKRNKGAGPVQEAMDALEQTFVSSLSNLMCLQRKYNSMMTTEKETARMAPPTIPREIHERVLSPLLG